MARHKLNLSLPSLDRFTLLFHGEYGAGKTHLLGDALAYFRDCGKSIRFLNVKGEDGYATLGGLNLGDIGETVETYADTIEALNEYKKAQIDVLGIDGVHWLYEKIMRHHVGDRLPRVGDKANEWGEIHYTGRDLFTQLHYVAPVVITTCASDKSVDQLTGKTRRTPDLPGRMAVGIAGLYDFVFYLTARATGPTTVKRILLTAPTEDTVIRYRLPRPLPPELEIPNGRGGWERLLTAIQETFKQ